jgi:hypothetical protein
VSFCSAIRLNESPATTMYVTSGVVVIPPFASLLLSRIVTVGSVANGVAVATTLHAAVATAVGSSESPPPHAAISSVTLVTSKLTVMRAM